MKIYFNLQKFHSSSCQPLRTSHKTEKFSIQKRLQKDFFTVFVSKLMLIGKKNWRKIEIGEIMQTIGVNLFL